MSAKETRESIGIYECRNEKADPIYRNCRPVTHLPKCRVAQKCSPMVHPKRERRR